jgi:hypothetical protein
MGAFLDQLSNRELAIIVSGTSKNVPAVGTSGTPLASSWDVELAFPATRSKSARQECLR